MPARKKFISNLREGVGETQSASCGRFSEQNEAKKQGAMRSAGGEQCDYVSEETRLHIFSKGGRGSPPLLNFYQ